MAGSAKAGNGFQAAQNLRAGDSKEQEAERFFSPVEECRFQGGFVKGEHQEQCRGFHAVSPGFGLRWVRFLDALSDDFWGALARHQRKNAIDTSYDVNIQISTQ